MKNVPSKYKCIRNDRFIKLEEYKSSITFDNKDRLEVIQVKIDGEVCTDNTTRKCDYLITNKDERNEIFIELKGKNISHAIDQIEESIKMFGEYKENRRAYIVCTKVPQYSIATKSNSGLQNKKEKLLNDYNVKLTIKENIKNEKLF